MCFPYLGLWETGMYLAFGFKHVILILLEFGLNFFLLVNDKSLGLVA